MTDVNWDDLKLFHIVATEGGLAGAASLTGISAPTLGRKMLFLERTMGRTLFIRSQQGYKLAPDGVILFERVQHMRRTAAEISQWHGDAFSLPIVSISSNIWLMGFIAENTSAIRGPDDAFRLCCKHFGPEDDLTYRRGMIGVFDASPQHGNFAVRKSVTVNYCAYRSEGLTTTASAPWISIGTEVAASDAEKWVFCNREQMIHTWTNAPALLPRLIQSGAGKGVLPAYIGDTLPGVVRDGEIIEELAHNLWITVNDDDRHTAEMRVAIDRLAALLKRNERLFEGMQAEPVDRQSPVILFPRS